MSCKHSVLHPFLIRHWSDDGAGSSSMDDVVSLPVFGDLIDRVGNLESGLRDLGASLNASQAAIVKAVVGHVVQNELLHTLISPVVEKCLGSTLQQMLKETLDFIVDNAVKMLKVELGLCGHNAGGALLSAQEEADNSCRHSSDLHDNAREIIPEDQLDPFQTCNFSNFRSMSDARASHPDHSIHMHDSHYTPLHEACPSTSVCDILNMS